jgi:hypothetical protein
MEARLAAVTVALRVLNAINQKRQPDKSDVEQLRQLSQLPAQAPIDEIACDVVQQFRPGSSQKAEGQGLRGPR